MEKLGIFKSQESEKKKKVGEFNTNTTHQYSPLRTGSINTIMVRDYCQRKTAFIYTHSKKSWINKLSTTMYYP